MLVKNGDRLARDDVRYRVVCADHECFVIAKEYFVADENCMRACYKELEAYCNDETVNTLEELNFIKEE